MSPGERDREAARRLFVAWDADPDSRQQVQRAIEAIATARAEARRGAFSEAIELCHAASTEQVKSGDDSGAVALAAIALIIESHAALRAKAGEGDPK